jgi:uncharacterized protein YdaL
MHSSNSFNDCEGMFIPDFVKLDEVIKSSLDKKAEEAQDMLDSIATMLTSNVQ